MARHLATRHLGWAACAVACATAWLPVACAQTAVLNPKALPLGDGRISTTPQRGYVFSCVTDFQGSGAQHAGDWIQGSTWDATRKIWVQGEVLWPNARFSLQTTATERMLSGNALPVGHATGNFPIARSDPAYQIDRNPNTIVEQTLSFTLPLQPTLSASAGCVPMGMIGVALNGVPIFNALDAAGRDAVAHEVQDRCHGHPQERGVYHYHGPSDCLAGSGDNNALLGYALDGFGIYSGQGESGRELTNADLDECHGRTSPVMWNGKQTSIYHYVMTREYPYTIGCYRGNAVRAQPQPMKAGSGPAESIGRPGQARRPPAEAIAACSGKADDSVCAFTSPRGMEVRGQCRKVGAGAGEFACVPAGR